MRRALSWALIHFAGLRAVLALTVIGSLIGLAAASYSRPHFVPQVSTVAPAVTQDQFRGDLAQVLADQRHSDAVHREAWIAEGYSHDLQVLADDGQNPVASDAQAYLDAAYAGPSGDYVSAPPPGWQGPYAQLRSDLNALAAASGLPQAPAPPYAISGQAVPMHPWSQIMTTGTPKTSSAKSSGSGTSVSYSTSSTGAHSVTVTAKARNGAVTTTTTNKTSVSAKGVVTQTHTVTASG